MGSLYFIFKNTLITIVIICLLQFEFKGKTLENRLTNFIHLTAVPKFLGTKTTNITAQSLQITSQDLKKIRAKIYNNPVFKDIKNNIKEVFLKEVTSVIKESENKKKEELKQLEK